MQVVISKPSPPHLAFVGSGGGLKPFLNIFVDPPDDFGDGNFSDGSRNTTIKLISYNISISSTSTFSSAVYHALVHLNDPMNQKSSSNHMIAANNSIPLTYGIRYYVRVKAQNC